MHSSSYVPPAARGSHASTSASANPLWLFDAGADVGFQVYSDELSRQLDNCLLSSVSGFAFSVGAHHYEVNLEHMVQRNTKTNTRRAVVRLLLQRTHAVLDRDIARAFGSMSYDDVLAAIKERATQPVHINRKRVHKGALMTMATSMYHESTAFPVLHSRDGSPFAVWTKTGKLIRGGAKPTRLDVAPVPPVPPVVVAPVAVPRVTRMYLVPRAYLAPRAPRTVYDKAWAVAFVRDRGGGDDLANRIARVEDLTDRCQPLMEMFSTFKKMMAHDTTVTTLFHGTSPVAVLKIIESGFDCRLNQRAMYGKGNYFAVNIQYAFGIAQTNPYGEKVVIVALIVHSRVAKGATDMALPPDGFDTTVDNENAPSIYVTYKVRAYTSRACVHLSHC